MRQFHADAPCLDLRLFKDLRHVIDRAVGHARRFKQLEPFVLAAFLEYIGKQPGQLGSVFDALTIRGKPRILGQFGAPCRLAEFPIEVVVAAGEDHLAIERAKGLVGNDVRMQVADSLRRLAGREVVGVLVREQGDLRIEQREVEMLPLARAFAMRERSANGDRCIHAGDDVGDRHARALRPAAGRAIGLARHAHHSPHALDHEVVAGPLAIRTGLAEAGDRAVDQARIRLTQIFIPQAVPREITVLVVLDHDIALGGELTRDRLTLGDGDVESQRFLAAVRRAEIGRVLRLLALPVTDPGWPEGARIITWTGALDLDDLGAEIGEVLACPGPGENARQIEDTNVRKRAGHALASERKGRSLTPMIPDIVPLAAEIDRSVGDDCIWKRVPSSTRRSRNIGSRTTRRRRACAPRKRKGATRTGGAAALSAGDARRARRPAPPECSSPLRRRAPADRRSPGSESANWALAIPGSGSPPCRRLQSAGRSRPPYRSRGAATPRTMQGREWS